LSGLQALCQINTREIMPMRDDFAVFILTHGRPDRVFTAATLEKAGYTGKTYFVIDDEDKTAPEYRERYGDRVLTFSKAEIAREFDEGDNFNDRRAIIYARNACFKLASQVGARYFIQFDDDYYWFGYRLDRGWSIHGIDGVFDALIRFLESTPALTVAFSQGGDHIGGAIKPITLKRKAMNSFVCSTDRPFQFVGRINEDVNTYTSRSRIGDLFFTLTSIQLDQKSTQTNAGGMTELYLDSGTYVKSFYSVMYAPSCVTIRDMGEVARRLHHQVNWNAAAPRIIREEHSKSRKNGNAAHV
jgi:hypothetical protein